MNKKIQNHFKSVDLKLHGVIDKDMETVTLESKEKKPGEYFSALCRTIIGQQLSGKAARSIHSKVLENFKGKTITPKKVIEFTDHQLRAMGMSYAKARALRDLSEKVISKEVSFKNTHTREPIELRNMLLTVKGVGPWTVDMFLMFTIGLEDVFSYNDLGLQKGVQKLYKLKSKPDEKKMKEVSEKWSPYRTYAALLLWHHIDNQ